MTHYLAPNRQYQSELTHAAANFLDMYPAHISHEDGSIHVPESYDIAYKKEPSQIDEDVLQTLVAAYLDKNDVWYEFVPESDDHDVIHSTLVKALKGEISSKQLGDVIIKAATKYHKERIINDFIEEVDREAIYEARNPFSDF